MGAQKPMPTADRPFTPEMLAERWLCSAETVRRMCRTGALRHYKIGGQYRIKPEAVEIIECNQESGVSMDDMSQRGSNQTERVVAIASRPKAAKPQRRKAETFFGGRSPGPLVT